jgi:hypothetical protein
MLGVVEDLLLLLTYFLDSNFLSESCLFLP